MEKEVVDSTYYDAILNNVTKIIKVHPWMEKSSRFFFKRIKIIKVLKKFIWQCKFTEKGDGTIWTLDFSFL